METIKIPKTAVIKLIKENKCSFYDYNNYRDYQIEVIEKGYTEFKTDIYDELFITEEDLATILFDRSFSNSNVTLIVY